MICNSPKVIRFIDGFGNKRIFCKGCGRSFLEESFMGLRWQKKIADFSSHIEFKSQIPR